MHKVTVDTEIPPGSPGLDKRACNPSRGPSLGAKILFLVVLLALINGLALKAVQFNPPFLELASMGVLLDLVAQRATPARLC